jgi:hypothetical protein
VPSQPVDVTRNRLTWLESFGEVPHTRITNPSRTLALVAIVALATVTHAALALRSPSIWIVPDELNYAELAKSLGGGGLPRIRGDVSLTYGLGYPIILAPLWAIFDDVTNAYTAAKILNSLVLSLTAVPAFSLARRFVDDKQALLVAALTVAVPPMLYAGTLMTEVALYPAVTLALLAIVRALDDPRVGAQFGALGWIGLASTVKTLALILLPAYLAGIALFGWLETQKRAAFLMRLKAYWITGLVLAPLGLGLMILGLTRGSPHRLLGGYSLVVDHMEPRAIPRWAVLHLAELDLAVAVIPLIASLVVCGRGLTSTSCRTERLYVGLAVPVVTCWLVAVGTFGSVPFLDELMYPENVSRLQGRSTFAIAPLFFVGLALVLSRRGVTRRLAVPFVGLCVALPAAIPLHEMDGNVRFQALSLVPWVSVRDSVSWPFGVLLLSATLGACFLVGTRDKAPSAWLVGPVLMVFAMVTITAHVSMQRTSEWSRTVGTADVADWIDQSVPDGASVTVLWYEPPGRPFVDLAQRHFGLFVAEFFNRSVGRVYEIGSPLPYGLPATRARLQDGEVVLGSGHPVRLGDFVFAPCYVKVDGRRLAYDAQTGSAVWEVGFPVRAVVQATACAEGASE